MGTIVTYNGSQSDPVKRNTAFLPTAGKYMTGDITITDTGMDADDCVYQDKDGFIVLNDSYGTYVDKETLEITANGTYTAPERKTWNRLDVKVPGSELFKSIVNRTITEIKAEDLEGIESITAHAFRYCTHLVSANIPSVITIGNYSFDYCSALTDVNCPNATTLGQYAFHQCPNLSGVLYLPKVQTFGTQAFYNVGLTKIIIPSAISLNTILFAASKALVAVDIGQTCSSLNQGSLFSGCTSLNTLIVRYSAAPTTLSTNAFTSTPFASDGTGGTLYVPSALVDSYQSATNWSTILSYENNQTLPIEGSIYETQYADGTPIT